MHSEEEKIKSIRETLAGGYIKPDLSRVEAYEKALTENTEATNYLKIKRGLTLETIKHFRLGYAAERNAISIPVFKGDELVNIRYRSLDPKAPAKYTQEKGCEVWLYNDAGIERAKKLGNLLIVEGEIDLMSAWQAGYKSIVSPASGKDSYGIWLELLDSIPRVYIAYDNDKPGKQSASDLADRVGIDKSFEVCYPEGVKDANEYFAKHTPDEFKQLIVHATPFYKHKFSGVGDIVDGLRERPEPRLELDTIPFVKWKESWLGILSADKDGGKTTFALNVANELVEKEIPTLFFPFERGVKEVGERFLQVRYRKQEDDLFVMSEEEFVKMKSDAIELPLYFAKPDKQEFFDTVRRARRIFNTKFIIVDHLDYFIHGRERFSEQADFIKQMKELCQELDIMAIVIHHVNKPEGGRKRKKLEKEDLKGVSDIYQIAEVVVLIYPGENSDKIVDVVNNKGETGPTVFSVDMSTGRFTRGKSISANEMAALERAADEAWGED